MKIKNQARLLVAGIVLVPLLVIVINIIIQSSFIGNERELPAYEDIFPLLDEHIDAGDMESLTRIITRSRNRSELAVFRDDYFVLYSTISDFVPGFFTYREKVLSLLDGENQPSTYSFYSRDLNESRVYILSNMTPQAPMVRSRPPPFFIPAALIIVFIILLTIFSICMSIIIARTITNSVQVLEDVTRRIAEGNLDLNVDVKGSNEITSLTNSLNKMRNALKEEELRRSRFIMGISHDLKTPLALIKGYAEAIEDGVTEDPASRSGAATIIASKADQLEGMINDLINFVRMETGEWREKLNEINLSVFLKNLMKSLSMDVELLHHKLISEINLPENLSKRLDEKLVQRAFENLINNAVRHTPDGSVINFSAVLVENTVELTISDNGGGIDKDALPHIFEMFYRGSPSRREHGMGLGLAVVKWVVDYHGWTISVSSGAEGTIFTITIPAG